MEIRLLRAIEFVPLVVIGIPGNVYIMLKFIFIRIVDKKLLPTNIILMVLALINLLVLLARVTPQYMYTIGLEGLLDDGKCKLIVYTYRVSRAMSISITSLLCCHQCILIAPTTKIWIYLKPKMSQNMVAIIIVILFVNLLLYPSSAIYAQAKNNLTNSPYTIHLVSCRTDFLTHISYFINGILLVIKDLILVALMSLASSYIVNMLLHHQQNIRVIRNSDNGQSKSVTYKAARAVILLVVLYVVLFGLDMSMWIYSLFNSTPDMNDARIILACSYSALSPVVIIPTNPKLQFETNCLKRSKLQGNSDYKDSENKTQLSCISNDCSEKKY
ncbi:olfactory receptor class A-like protein 1 [Mixophyes fleayi]|uniref:olfactory receptor class A-like protein 1 n=1 Tax=Mixophyes fleayi TaxID=3061075 RepID=UPI003F4DB9AA